MKPASFPLLGLTLLVTLSLCGCGADTKNEAATPYPLEQCLVTGEKIGADKDMKPHAFTVDGQEVKLCCKSCLKDFTKDQAKHMATIAEARKIPK